MNKLISICAALILILTVSSAALATTAALVPPAQNAAPGDTVTVSVYMTITEPITMSAISTEIIYDTDAFAYNGLVKGALLTANWDLSGNENPPLRIGGFLWEDPFMESFEPGEGIVFSFDLKVNENAPVGSYNLTWGIVDGGTGQGAGFDYGDENFADVVVPSFGATIHIVPEPATMILLGFGGLLLRKVNRE